MNLKTTFVKPKVRWMLLAAGIVAVAGPAAQAQRPPRDEEPMMAVAVTRAMPGRGRGHGNSMKFETREISPAERKRMQEEMRRIQAMTPEQREEHFREMQLQAEERREDELRAALAKVGVEDPVAQDAILAFIREQQEARVPLDEQRVALADDLIKGEITDVEVEKRQKELTAAVEQARKKFETALKALDEKVGISKNPRLKALLLTAGVLDDTEGFVMGPAGLDSVVPMKPLGPGMLPG